MFTLPKVLYLDYSKWRCGGRGKYKLGEGGNSLNNRDGYQCCLGQFSEQAGVNFTDKFHYGMPEDLPDEIEGLSFYGDGSTIDTDLSTKAAEINDDYFLTTKERVRTLQELFKQEGYVIKLRNFPEDILTELGQFNEPTQDNNSGQG